VPLPTAMSCTDTFAQAAAMAFLAPSGSRLLVDDEVAQELSRFIHCRALCSRADARVMPGPGSPSAAGEHEQILQVLAEDRPAVLVGVAAGVHADLAQHAGDRSRRRPSSMASRGTCSSLSRNARKERARGLFIHLDFHFQHSFALAAVYGQHAGAL